MYYIDSNVKKETFLNRKMRINIPSSFKDSHNEFTIKEVQQMIKEKKYTFSDDSLNELVSKNDNLTRKFKFIIDKFIGRTIGIVDGEYRGLIQHIFYLFSDNTFKHEFLYTLKNEKTNEFYVLLKKEYYLSIYLSSEKIFNLYKKNKDEILNTNLMTSIENYKYAYNDFKFREVKAYDDLEEVVIKTYPFYKEKIDILRKENRFIHLEGFFYKDYLMPFLKFFHLNNFFEDNFESIDEGILQKIIKQKNNLSSFKQLIPYANKDTMDLFETIIYSERNLGIHEWNEYSPIHSFNLSILSAFKNTKRLNLFLECIQSSNNESDIYFLKEENEVENFYENILPSFYSSQIKYENNLIKTARKYFLSIESDLNIQEENFNKGLQELECECDNDDLCDCLAEYESENFIMGDNNYAMITGLMEDIFKSYQALLTLYDKQTDDIKQKIDSLLSKKMNDIELIHNELADMVSELSDDKILFPKSNLIISEIISNDIELFEVLDNIVLKKVGREMHHCVASYEKQITMSNTSIFAIKKENNFVGCLELNNNLKAILQVKGKYNMKITDGDIVNVIESFVYKNKLNVRTNDVKIKTKL